MEMAGSPAAVGSAKRLPAGLLASLAAVAGLSWIALLWLGEAMEMGGMSDAEMAARPLTIQDFSLTLGMWVTMMVGMMLPSATPMILLYRRVVARCRRPRARVALFVSAYVTVWGAFSLLASLLQVGLGQLAWMTAMSMRAAPWLGGAILISAGVYQFMPGKDACLARCRSPLTFVLRYPMATVADSWRLGVVHGAYCIGCCWALMAVLFAVGVMNLLWIVALAIFVLLEKVTRGNWLPRASGLALIGWGLAVWGMAGA